jgi:hypothetical protein
MDFDDPAAGVALTAKGDLDAERLYSSGNL